MRNKTKTRLEFETHHERDRKLGWDSCTMTRQELDGDCCLPEVEKEFCPVNALNTLACLNQTAVAAARPAAQPERIQPPRKSSRAPVIYFYTTPAPKASGLPNDVRAPCYRLTIGT